MDKEPLTMEDTNKKTHWGGLLIVAAVAVLVILFGNNFVGPIATETETREGTVAGVVIAREEVTLVVSADDNVRTMTFNLAEGETAMSILIRASLRENFSVDKTKYDFGTLVDAIDGIGGDENRYWLYYVNGELAQVGADAYNMSTGDIIEFRYE